jgi:hypothetical protein
MTALEEWRWVVGAEGRYEVSNHGRVRSYVKRGRGNGRKTVPTLLNPITNPDGYKQVRVDDKRLSVHRLALIAFVGLQPGMMALHHDDDPANNRLSNLRWGTRLDNAADWKRNGIRTFPNQNALKTHCKNGHEFSPENTRVRASPNGHPARECRTCKRAAAKRRRQLG